MDGFDDQYTSSHTIGRVAIIGRLSGRRRWTVEQELAILRDAFASEGSERTVCERHEIGSGQALHLAALCDVGWVDGD